MPFTEERAAFEAELDAYYAAQPVDMPAIEAELVAFAAENPSWSPFRLKALGYEQIARRCPVKVFRHFPFWYELGVGKPRTNLGEGGVGGWHKRLPFGQRLTEIGGSWWHECGRRGLSVGWAVLDDNHHSLGNDNVFRGGLRGFVAEAEERLKTAATDDEREFLTAMIAGLNAQMALSCRFADEAQRLLADETDPAVRAHLERVAGVARRVPADPPETFYEALATVLFMRETTQALEGNGISILGHMDRILGPYYKRDLAAGRITREEAKDLLAFFLAMSDVRFGIDRVTQHVGTNTTVMIGGCDATGAVICNDVTRMIAEIYREHRLVDPKLNVRISNEHPREFVDLIAGLTASGCNSISLFNDDVVIAANAKMGKAVEDCRLYAGGGCQENVLENTEINSRATMYLSAVQVFLMGFFPTEWDWLRERDGVLVRPYEGCETFDGLYETFLSNLSDVLRAHVEHRNLTEREGLRYNPCPLHSATISDCIANARDMMAGGARYNFGSTSLTGVGTLVDSLYAVRKVVFDDRLLPLEQLRHMLATDFDGEEAFRQYLVNRVPKFGQDDEDVRAISAQVFADLARVSRGFANTRGGPYEASLFAFRSFTYFGEHTGATPDGRKAGEHLSPGMGPSMVALGRENSVSRVLRSLEPLDLTDYPVVAVLDVKLPASAARTSPEVIATVIGCFLDCGGSVLQVNTVDPAVLLEAREHPERHPDLVVRISGYSAYFRTLPPAVQQEVIDRTLLQVER